MAKFIENPDLEYCQNNGVLAVTYGERGRLAHLKRIAVFENKSFRDLVQIRCMYDMTAGPVVQPHKPRVWVFMDFCAPDENTERYDAYWWHARGVSVGSVEEGYDFLARCRQAGITTRFTTMEVPFSNGQNVRYVSKELALVSADFFPSEVAMVDVRLPTVQLLVAHLRF